MSFCPFMSNAKEKVECVSDCELFIPQEFGLDLWGKRKSGCVQRMSLLEQEAIRQKIDPMVFAYKGDNSALKVRAET
ncbi:MAG: hypothetical protein FWG29_10425 [Treponema sp.]|nr:hypothetical protein [Treponema sp.]